MDYPENPAQKIETREDEEQGEKLSETVDLLLAAGYFRARIKGLSPFDKVVGGMVWCMSTCDFDVDVDLLFQENSTIGQKIALTEKIVSVLPKMKCPHRIEPHQIQGLDFINIFPVIQWLVKRAIETREELGDQIRAYSITQFSKNFSLPQEVEAKQKKPQCIEAIKTLKNSYRPKRMFKKPQYDGADEETQVHSTLLEYGRRYGASRTSQNEKETKNKKAVSAALTKGEEVNEKEIEEERIKSLMKDMSEADIKQMLSSQTVGSIVGLQSDSISQIALEYAQRHEMLQQETSELKAGKVGGMQTHKRQVAIMEKALEAEKNKLENAQNELRGIETTFEGSKIELEKQNEMKEKLITASEELTSMESSEETKSVLAQLRSLVALNENLKKQEQEFKAQCKVELKELEGKIEKLQLDGGAEDDPELERTRRIEEQYTNDIEKFRKIRLLMAKKNREIASYQWKIDDVPSRAELAQYQGRFIELYNQVASTHKETKQFYSLYNTLDDTKVYLEKEVGYLNSIHDGFEQALAQSASSKAEFLLQLEHIVQGVQLMKNKVEKKFSLEKDKRDGVSEKYMELVEKQRSYVKAVRDFQEECKKSEIIQSKLRAAGIIT